MEDVRGQAAVRTLLESIGENPDREGLQDTPARVVRALREMTSGVKEDPKALLAVSFDGGQYDEIVALAGIPFTSLCEHHLLPFNGVAGVAYLPRAGKVVGLSKLARLVDCFAKRLQLQERMSMEIATALEKHLDPRGVAVVLEAEHACMACRGVKKPGAVMRTSVMLGVFREKAEARAEVCAMLRRNGQ